MPNPNCGPKEICGTILGALGCSTYALCSSTAGGLLGAGYLHAWSAGVPKMFVATAAAAGSATIAVPFTCFLGGTIGYNLTTSILPEERSPAVKRSIGTLCGLFWGSGVSGATGSAMLGGVKTTAGYVTAAVASGAATINLVVLGIIVVGTCCFAISRTNDNRLDTNQVYITPMPLNSNLAHRNQDLLTPAQLQIVQDAIESHGIVSSTAVTAELYEKDPHVANAFEAAISERNMPRESIHHEVVDGMRMR